MELASWKDRKPIAAELKAIYGAIDTDKARRALRISRRATGAASIRRSASWRRNRQDVIPFFAFPVAVRRIIYTTNAIEALNSKLRRAVRRPGPSSMTSLQSNCCTSSCARSRNGSAAT